MLAILADLRFVRETETAPARISDIVDMLLEEAHGSDGNVVKL